MFFPAAYACTGPTPVRAGDSDSTRTFTKTHIAAIVTDVFFAALAITTGILIILAAYGVNLGPLNAISQFTEFSGKIMILAGVAMIASLTFFAIIFMCKHISKLQALKKTLDGECRGQEAKLEALKKQLADEHVPVGTHNDELNKHKQLHAGEKTRLDEQIAKLTAELNTLKTFVAKETVSLADHNKAVKQTEDKYKEVVPKDQFDTKVKDFTTLEEKNKQLQKAVDALKTLVGGDSEKLVKEKENLEATVAQLKQEIAKSDDSLVKMDQLFKQYKAEKEALEKERNQFKTDKEAADLAKGQLDKQIAQIQQEKDAVEKERNKFSQQIAQIASEKDKLEKSIQDLNTNFAAERTKLENEVKSQDGEISKLKTELQLAQVAGKEPPEAVKKAMQKIDELEDQLKALKKERDTLKTDVEHHEATMNNPMIMMSTMEHNKQMIALSDQLRVEKEQVGNEKKSREAAEIERDNLRNRVKKLEAETNDAQAKLDEHLKKQGSLDQLAAKEQAINDQLHKTNQHLKTVQAEIERLQKEDLEAVKKSVEDEKGKLKVARDSAEQMAKRAQDEQTNLDRVRDERKDLDKKSEEQRIKAAEDFNKLEEKRKEKINQLKEELEQLNTELAQKKTP